MHTKTHTDKPVECGRVHCEDCKKAFTSEQHLKRHAIPTQTSLCIAARRNAAINPKS